VPKQMMGWARERVVVDQSEVALADDEILVQFRGRGDALITFFGCDVVPRKTGCHPLYLMLNNCVLHFLLLHTPGPSSSFR
jgi:hypothetical protein